MKERSAMHDIHVLPLITVCQVRIRKSTCDEPSQHCATSASESTRSKYDTCNLPCRALIPQEYDPLVRYESVEQQDDWVCTLAISVQMWMLWARY